MKGFIEVTYQGSAKYTINVNQIVWVSATCDGKKTSLILHDCTRLTVDESYDEVKARIVRAVK